MTKLILDTHIIAWSLLDPDKISGTVKHEINLAQKEDRLAICSISMWEIAMLTRKKRIDIYEPIKHFLKSITEIDGLSVLEITPDIAAESVSLVDDFHSDPADRIIVATTKILGGTLLTRDQKILSWAKSGHIKCLKS